MTSICEHDLCCGCMTCVQVCNHKAITIHTDEEGFDRPIIDEHLCVDCGLCKNTCPANKLPEKHEPLRIFSGWSKDESTRINSSSGGAFTEIARPILQQGGVVFGCALSKNLQAEHVYVENMEDLQSKLRGSKYVQSRIGNSYKQAKAFLQTGRTVLFSGTPCQIAGLKNYLRRDYDNLYTVDLLCHGVSSPLIFEEYKKFMEESQEMKIENINFRCKKSSWIFYNMTLKGHVEKNTRSVAKTYMGGGT